MTDRLRDSLMFAAFSAALVLLLHVTAGCGDGDRAPTADATVVVDDAGVSPVMDAMMDSGGGSDAPGNDAGGLPDAPPPPDASAPDAAAAD